MRKICGDSIYIPLKMIFKQGLLTGKFPFGWKNESVFPIHIKCGKQNINGYRPVIYLQFVVNFLKDLFLTKC